ncbi:MAG: hypothetical protein Q7T49_00110 [bacterium]|nr:hypothetical protein [bacterium]
MMFGLTDKELKILRGLNTPVKIQNFLDTLPINYEEKGETLMSPRRVLQTRRAHCFEGALLAAAALLLHGRLPLLMDFKTVSSDESHVVALFKEGKCWGAISKTNHGILRYRDAIYQTPRELARSYFNEYFDFTTGAKTLRAYSQPFNLNKFGRDWLTSERDLWFLDKTLAKSPHVKILTPDQIKKLRPADKIEIKAGQLMEW